jgi:transketolase
MSSTHNLEEQGAEIRRLVVEMSWRSKSGETGSSLSISDLLAVLYFKTLHIDPKKPLDPARDRFVLSKGHGAAALYAALALRGFFPKKMLLGHRLNGGAFHGHPSRGSAPGVEVSTGSLGHGLSIAVGMAYAIKNTQSKVYVLIGDGECNEGSIWEAALSAGALRLPNIVAIVDENKFQGFDSANEKNPFDTAKQWEAFGWEALRVEGHNLGSIEKAFNKARRAKRPVVVIADTISGKGVAEIENTLDAHYYVPKERVVSNTESK